MSLKKFRDENLSLLEFSGDTDSESERLQFGHGTYPKLSHKFMRAVVIAVCHGLSIISC